MIYSGKY